MPFALFLFLTLSLRADFAGPEDPGLPSIGPVGPCAFIASIGLSLTSLVLLVTWKPDAGSADGLTLMDARPYPDWNHGLKIGGICASSAGALMFTLCEAMAAMNAFSMVSLGWRYRPWWQLSN